MASHITCHVNDILPNTFPPPRPTPKDHGFVSRYEQTHFMKNIGLPSCDDEDDELENSIPAQFMPMPTQTSSCVKPSGAPGLCLTPDNKFKKPKSKGKEGYSPEKYQNTNNNALSKDSKGKSLKVQFDPVVDVKHMSPEQHRSESDISIIDVGTMDSSLVTADTEKQLNELRISSNLNTGQNVDISNSQSDYRPLPEVHLNCNTIPKVPVPFSQNSYNKKSLETSNQQIRTDVSTEIQVIPERLNPRKSPSPEIEDIDIPFTSQMEHVLARPEFNSTAAKMRELQKLKESSVDVEGTVKELLKKNSVKTQIEEKAYSRVNIKTDTYTDLPSIEVKEDDLVNKAERKESTRVKPFKRQKPTSEVIGKAPDVMEFFHSGLQKESASYTVPGLSRPQFKPCTAPQETAFDLYRHLRAWEQLDQ